MDSNERAFAGRKVQSLTPLAVQLVVILLATIFACTAFAQIPAKRYNPDFTSSNPYGLIDLDNFAVGSYGYCKWGNLMSENSATLPYTRLTQFKDELFLNQGRSILSPVSPESVGYQQDPANLRFIWPDNGLTPPTYYALMRKLHFQIAITNYPESAQQVLSSDNKKLIILIHGWNPNSSPYSYDNELAALASALYLQIKYTDWRLMLYHWEKDADNGPINAEADVNGTEAAEIAHQHGQHLGELLAVKCPNLQKVHFIAHSAGTWAARAATRYLLQNTGAKAQVTLLDPFIPGELSNNTSLTKNAVSAIPSMDPSGSGQLVLLENYYAVDVTDAYGFEAATSTRFAWNNTIGVQRRVDWGDWYKSHEGPIQFYADTVQFVDNPLVSPGLENEYFEFNTIGWKRSMFYQEPHTPSTLSAVAVSTSQINLTWSDTVNETGFTIERRLGSSGSFSPIKTLSANVTSYSDTGLAGGTAYSYRVRAYNAAGDSEYSPICSKTTQPVAGTTYTLNIASSNPSSGISVWAVIGKINSATYTTPASPSFASGTAVWFTCASSLPRGLVFQKWQLDGNDYAFSTDITVTMDGPHTLTAIYGAAALPPRVLSSLTIEGPSSVDERNSAQYHARATYTDASSAYVDATAAWSDDSSYASISTTGLLDASAVSSDTDVVVQATFTAGGVTKTASKDVTIYNTDAVPTYTLTLAASHGYIGVQPKMNAYPAGTEVRLIASADDDYVFDHWSGNASGTDRTVYVAMNGNRSVTANFTADTSFGRLQVNLSPPQAVAEGAQWKAFPFTSWYNDGDQIDGVTPKRYYITLKDIPGWVAPQNIPVDVVGGSTAQVSGIYQEIPGAVQVAIEPAAASAAGARWRLDGGAWQSSETTINGVLSGNHQIEFQSISGWSMPATQPITVARAGITIRTGQYTPPPGLALVTAISPKTGPIGGGTLLTIEGANFLASSTVFVGGHAASNVTFLSATRLTAVTPSSPVFGSAAIVVTSGASSATNANGFAYGIPRGTNMTLITSSGGTYQAVACNNQYLFIGQGTTFMVYDIANPASPVFISSVTIPGLIQDIALSGNSAIVAANDAGVHIVDISNPTAPRLRGFYDTLGKAYGLTVLAGRAYVADGTDGLLILDVANPDAPTLLSSLDLGAFTYGVVLKNSVSGLYAVVSATGKMFIVDVSNPEMPSKLSQVAIGGENWSVAIAGNFAFLGQFPPGDYIVDISNLSSPVSRGSLIPNAMFATVAAMGNTVVLAGDRAAGAVQLVDVSGVTPTLRGHLYSSVVSVGAGPYRTVIQNGVAWIAGGSAVFGVNISNLDAPQRIFQKDDQGSSFEKVASSGSNVASATIGKVFAFSFSGSTLTPTASLSAQGGSNPYGFFFYGNTLFDVDGLFERYQMQSDGSLTPLASLTIPNVWPADAYLNGNRLLSIGQAYPGDSHAVITEHDPSGANWILRQKQFSFVGFGQIAGFQDCFFLAYPDDTGSKWNLAAFNWNASTPTWQISGLEIIETLQLSHNNRFMHVGERMKYRIYDLIDPAHPVPLSTNATTSYIRDILISGDEAYLAAEEQGVLVYDIADKSQPRLIRSYDTPGSPFALAKSGNRLMVADYQAGIQVLGLPDIVPPQVFVTAPVALPQFETPNSSITLGGAAEDDSGQISRVTWSNYRGGGGVAEGTTDWLVSAVSLKAGTNVLTVTAFDAEGNAGTDAITIISTPPDTSVPVINITGPTPNDEFVANTNVIMLSGSAADNQSVASVTWSNDFGASGSANLAGQNWSITNLPLVFGPNVFHVLATDAAGNSASDTAVVFLVPLDTNAPSINIEFPTLNAVYETEFSTLNLSGTATDNSSVAKVEWSNARGGQGIATGVAPWSVNDIPLQPGLNVIEVTATDDAGNASSDALSVVFTPPIPELAVARADGNLVLLWPTNAVGFVLESVTNFPATNWTLESLAPAIVNDQYVVTNSITGDKKFYRLKK